MGEQAVDPGESDRIELRIAAEGRSYGFSYRLRGGNWFTLAEEVDGTILSTEVAKGFIGSYIGLYSRLEAN